MTPNGERFRPSAAASPDRPHSLAAVAKDAAGDLLDLVGAQIRLVRAELSAELRTSLTRILSVAVFAPVMVVGYAFGMAALAAALAPYWGWPLALLALCGLQVVAAATGGLLALRRLARVRLLHRTAEEVSETVRRIEAQSHSDGDPSRGANHG